MKRLLVTILGCAMALPLAMSVQANEELLVRRVIARSGKNRIFVNGSPVSLTQLRDFVGGLVNIYGQNEHQSLQQAETHLPILDAFSTQQEVLLAYRDAYAQWHRLQQDLNNLTLAERERQQRLDMLCYQQQELNAANLVVGEEEQLQQERRLLLNAEKLTAATVGGYETLYAGQDAVCGKIAVVADQLDALHEIDPQLGALAETLRNNLYSLEDVAIELQGYVDKLEFEPQRQQQVEDRLALLGQLKGKYAPTIAELLTYLEKITDEIESLKNTTLSREVLKEELEQAVSHLIDQMRDLRDMQNLAQEGVGGDETGDPAKIKEKLSEIHDMVENLLEARGQEETVSPAIDLDGIEKTVKNAVSPLVSGVESVIDEFLDKLSQEEEEVSNAGSAELMELARSVSELGQRMNAMEKTLESIHSIIEKEAAASARIREKFGED